MSSAGRIEWGSLPCTGLSDAVDSLGSSGEISRNANPHHEQGFTINRESVPGRVLMG